jgi:hypothetical protein
MPSSNNILRVLPLIYFKNSALFLVIMGTILKSTAIGREVKGSAE